MLIYIKFIDKMEIKFRINLLIYVFMCIKKKKYKIRYDFIYIIVILSKLYICIIYIGIWILLNNYKNVRKFIVFIDD